MVESDYSYMAKKRVELGEEARTIVCLEVIDLGLVFLGGGAGLARELTKLTRKVNGFPPESNHPILALQIVNWLQKKRETHFWKCLCLELFNFAEMGERTSEGETIELQACLVSQRPNTHHSLSQAKSHAPGLNATTAGST